MEYDLVDVPPDQYICQICMKLLKEPQLTECCGQSYCRSCLDQWFAEKRKQQCPHCRSENFTRIMYLPQQRKIDKLRVYCSNKNEGCKKILELGELEEHLSVNAKGCEYLKIKCKQCRQYVFRNKLKDHGSECPQRKVDCKLCNESGPYSYINSEERGGHVQKCPQYPVDCPNNCKVRDLKRKDLEAHKEVCPLEPVKCPICGTVQDLKRNDLEAHKEVCPLEPVGCPRNCGTARDLKRKDLEAHKEACPLELVGCPRNCGTARDLKRKDLKVHKEVCPLEPVECPFHKQGCRQDIVRKDYEDHMKNTEQHLTSLKYAYEELREKYEMLIKEHKMLQDRHRMVTDEHKMIRRMLEDHHRHELEEQNMQKVLKGFERDTERRITEQCDEMKQNLIQSFSELHRRIDNMNGERFDKRRHRY